MTTDAIRKAVAALRVLADECYLGDETERAVHLHVVADNLAAHLGTKTMTTDAIRELRYLASNDFRNAKGLLEHVADVIERRLAAQAKAAAPAGGVPSAHELILSFGECWKAGVCDSLPCDCAERVAAFAARAVAEAVEAEMERCAKLAQAYAMDSGSRMTAKIGMEIASVIRNTP